MVVNLFLSLTITFKMTGIGHPFRLNKEIIYMYSISDFRNESLNEYKWTRSKKQVIRPRF